MPDKVPHHDSIDSYLLFHELREKGFSVDQIVGDTGLRESLFAKEDISKPFDQVALMFERAAELTGDDLLGFHHGLKRNWRREGLLAYVGLSAPTAMDYLINLSKYQGVFSDVVVFNPEKLESEGRLEWYFLVGHKVRRRQFVEFGVFGTIAHLRDLTGRQIYPREIGLRHHRRTTPREIERFAGGPIKWGQNTNWVVFEKRHLELPLNTADDHLHKVLTNICEDILARKRAQTDSFALRIEREIAKRLSAGSADQDSIARELGRSTRSLARRLEQEGTSFRQVLDEYRHALAVSLLTDSDASLSEAAYMLGYSNQSAFSSAFRRWEGVAPRTYREKNT